MNHVADKDQGPKTALIRVLGAGGAAFALLLAVAAPVAAQSTVLAVCAPHAEVAERLDSNYSEAPAAIGLASNGSIIELFSTADGATWTLVMTMPDGTSCTMAAGQAWETFPTTALDPQA